MSSKTKPYNKCLSRTVTAKIPTPQDQTKPDLTDTQASMVRRYQKLKKENPEREVFGQWSICLFHVSNGEMPTHIITKKDSIDGFDLIACTEKFPKEEHIFPSDIQAYKALEVIKSIFRDSVEAGCFFEVSCLRIDQDQ